MKCLICNSDTSYFFSKTYTDIPILKFMQKIGKIDYHKCNRCGFVLSKTHSELDQNTWNELNLQFHHYMENPSLKKNINQPPYAEQALMLSMLGKNGIIRTDDMLDYAAGYGTLGNILEKYHDTKLALYDPYVQIENSSKYIDKADLKTYKTVFNSAMFEHVLTRADLEHVNNIVDDDGCLIIHTVVCENIPADPDWFYLRPPVHTAFHTNKSMEILLQQWGYKSSIYCPQSKCWILLRENDMEIHQKISSINAELQNTWFIAKEGFVDYWKGF